LNVLEEADRISVKVRPCENLVIFGVTGMQFVSYKALKHKSQ